MAAQKDIWPIGKQYPKKAIAQETIKITTPKIKVNTTCEDE